VHANIEVSRIQGSNGFIAKPILGYR